MEKITEKSDGNLKISGDVIKRIAEFTAVEIAGVAVNGQRLETAESIKTVSSRFYNPVEVRLSKEAVEIDISIVVIQGFKAVNVAEAVQHSVKSAVQNMTAIPVAKVNVNVAGIHLVNDEE